MMTAAQELLNANGIYLQSYDLGNHTSICPKCSHTRSRAHQKTECVSVKIDDKGPTWCCHHCGDSGPAKGIGKSNGRLDPHDDRNFVATYDYPGFQKVRYPKGHEPRFRIRHRNARGAWEWGAGGANTDILYRIDEVNEAIALGREIAVVEGEKDANNLWAIRIPATCNSQGASEPGKKPKWKPLHSEQLRGADIVVIPDHDAAGYAHTDAICRMSVGTAKRVRRLDLQPHWPECPKGGDISDWLAAGHAREELDPLIAAAPDYGTTDKPDYGSALRPQPSPWHFHTDADPTPTAWLIKGVLPETGTGLISGQWGSYKTTVALYIAATVMTGALFANKFAVKRQGGVCYLALEGAGGLASRITAIARSHGTNGALPFAYRSDCPPLTTDGALDQLTALVEDAAKSLKERFDVPLVAVFVDTIVTAAGYAKAADDNDAAVAQRLMSVLAGLSQRTGALVLGLDHFGKIEATGTRGSSAKEGAADVVLALLADREVNGTVTNTRLAVRKQREGMAGLELPFTPKTVEFGTDQDGEPITRAVIDWEAAPAEQQTNEKDWSKSLRLLRRILMAVLVDGQDVCPFTDGPLVRAVDVNVVRAEFEKQYVTHNDGTERQRKGARRMAFARAMKTAQTVNLVTVREVNGTQLVWLARREDHAHA